MILDLTLTAFLCVQALYHVDTVFLILTWIFLAYPNFMPAIYSSFSQCFWLFQQRNFATVSKLNFKVITNFVISLPLLLGYTFTNYKYIDNFNILSRVILFAVKFLENFIICVVEGHSKYYEMALTAKIQIRNNQNR